MENYTYDTYGERIAERYDEYYGHYQPEMIEFLAGLTGDRPALELGIGTGRAALPLQAAGVEVHGIDASYAMLARLRAKPDGEKIPVSVGNFAAVNVEGQYGLIYVLFNTLFALLTQDEQVNCFQNAARHLLPEGYFAIEAFVPDMTRFTGDQSLRVVGMGDSKVRLDASVHDPVKQQVTAQHIILGVNGTELYPVKLRYIWPSEMDLMARLAGLELKDRYTDWDKSAFTTTSTRHVSVYGHPG